MHLILIVVALNIGLAHGEMIEVPNLSLYHITPVNPEQLRLLNQYRTSDSGMIFIHGVGKVDEPIEVITTPETLEYYSKDVHEYQLKFDMQFSPVKIQMSNTANNKPKGTQSAKKQPAKKAPENKPNQRFVPIEPIIEPDIYSGIFLKLLSGYKNHSTKLDILSFGGQVNSTMGNPYLCLGTKKSGDDHHHNKQWIFEESEMKGYYLLRNKKVPSAYVTWEDDEEQFLVLELRKETQRQYHKGAPSRKNALFKIEKRGKSSYEMRILGRQGKNIHIVIDPTWEGTTGCYLLRRTSKQVDHERRKLQYLFKIRRPLGSLKIVGQLENLRYQQTVNDLYGKSKKAGTIETITTRTVYNHGVKPINLDVLDRHERRDKFQFTFATNGNFSKVFDELYAPAGLGMAKTVGVDEKSNGKPAFILLNKTPGKDTTQKLTYRITSQLQVPAWSSLKYTVMFGWVEKLKVMFQGDLKIFGKTDRLTKSGNPRVVIDQTVNFQFVETILKYRKFAMGEMKKSSSDDTATMPIQGSIMAKSLGVKGDIHINVGKLSRNISVKCRK